MVTIADMLSIANNFGKEWMWVGRLLGLEDSLLDGIKEDLSQTYECTYKMLEWWCKKKDSDATYEYLARALLHRTVGMREVAEKFCVDHREKEIGMFQLLNDITTLSLREYQKQDKKIARAGSVEHIHKTLRKSRTFAFIPSANICNVFPLISCQPR